MAGRRSNSVLTSAGNSLTHSTYASDDGASQKRLEEQQAHHKRLLKQRLAEKKNGPGRQGSPNPLDDPDHPDNVRRREMERARQQKLAEKRLELKRRQNHKKAQLRAKQRRDASKQPETFTVVKDGRIHLGDRELTNDERRAKLKARQELQRQHRRETDELNYNPFDPNSKKVINKDEDIWDQDDADAMLASAHMLHELSANARHRHTTDINSDDNSVDDGMYSFESLGSFADLLEADKDKQRSAQKPRVASKATPILSRPSPSSSRPETKSDSEDEKRAALLRQTSESDDLKDAEDVSPVLNLSALDSALEVSSGLDGGEAKGAEETSGKTDSSEGNGKKRNPSMDDELDDLLNDIL